MLGRFRIILFFLSMLFYTAVFAQENQSHVVIFISFSMPKESIIACLQDAQKIHASVLIRGLVNNSFKETFKTVAQLVKEAKGGGIALDPLAFKTFNIKQVPAVVVIKSDTLCLKNRSCKVDQDYDVITGNITLSAALDEIRHHGKVANQEAEHVFIQLSGGTHA